MADEQHRAPAARDVAHLAEAFLLKLGVADRQHFIDDQDFRVEVRGDGEREAHVHAAAVALDRRIEELLDFGEGDDLVEVLLDVAPCHAEHRAVEKDVFSPSEFRVKSGPDFQERPHAPINIGAPDVGLVMRERIFSSVLLPAPLRPMIPSTSPCLTSKERLLAPRKFHVVLRAQPY